MYIHVDGDKREEGEREKRIEGRGGRKIERTKEE